MSNQENDNIMQRAADLIDELTSHPSRADIALEQAIDRNDLDELRRLVTLYEGELAQAHFYNNNIIEPNDVY